MGQMDAILNLEALSLGTAITAVVLVVLTLLFIRGYVSDHKRRSSGLPSPPGAFVNSLCCQYWFSLDPVVDEKYCIMLIKWL